MRDRPAIQLSRFSCRALQTKERGGNIYDICFIIVPPKTLAIIFTPPAKLAKGHGSCCSCLAQGRHKHTLEHPLVLYWFLSSIWPSDNNGLSTTESSKDVGSLSGLSSLSLQCQATIARHEVQGFWQDAHAMLSSTYCRRARGSLRSPLACSRRDKRLR